MSEPIQRKPFALTMDFAIQLAVLIIGLTVSYVTLDLRSQHAAGEIDDLQAEHAKMRTEMRELQTSQIRLDERFTNIMTVLSRIDDRLERYESRP